MVNEHLLDQLNTLKSQASVRLRGSILIRSSFLYKSMRPCTKIKYERGKQKHLFLPSPRAASEVTLCINLEKPMRCSELCSWYLQYQEDLCPLGDWKKIKNCNISFAPARAFPMQVNLPAQFLQPFALYVPHKQERYFRRVWAGWEDWTDWEVLGLLCLGLCWNLLMELAGCCGSAELKASGEFPI